LRQSKQSRFGHLLVPQLRAMQWVDLLAPLARQSVVARVDTRHEFNPLASNERDIGASRFRYHPAWWGMNRQSPWGMA
jgi:hypothetical protein